MKKEGKKNFFKNAAIGFGLFCLLIISSEIIYTYNNKPSYFAIIHFKFINYYLEKGDLNKALIFLDKIAYLHIRERYTNNPPKNSQIKVNNKVDNIDADTKNQIQSLLQQKIPKNASYKRAEEVSNIYYHVGLILYDKKYYEGAYSHLQTAVLINPGLSFLHVELANAYFTNEDFDKGMEVLKRCLEDEKSRNHCNDYLNSNVKESSYGKVGSFEEITDRYQGSD